MTVARYAGAVLAALVAYAVMAGAATVPAPSPPSPVVSTH